MPFLTSLMFSLCFKKKADFTKPVAVKLLLKQLREKVDLYTSGLLSAEPVWSKVSQVIQTKGKKHLGITTTADLLHSCFSAVMNYFQAMVIHHKADNESTLTGLFKSAHYKPFILSTETPSLIMEIESIVANQCSNCKWVLWEVSFGTMIRGKKKKKLTVQLVC